MREIQRQDAQQHEHAARECVQEKLDGGVEFPGSAPDTDDEVHRDQHEFPEHVEEEEIEGQEYADHAGLQEQEHGVVFLDAVLDGIPGAENGDEAHQRGEHDQQEADAVEADVVIGAQRGNPLRALFELISGVVQLEAREQRQ